MRCARAGVSDFNKRAAEARGTVIWPLRVKGDAITLQSGLADQYWSCFYWAVTTLVKVPWVAPHTWMEQLFTAVIIIVGTFTFSVIIGQITMLQKAYDMARQARSERLAKMRTFCNTRHVPAAITHEVLNWTVADQDFSALFVGRGRLSMLPPSMRGPLLQQMYANLLESFPFQKGGMSTAGLNALLIKLNPLVLMRGMGLIEPNSTSTTLYVLQKGCLRIALPKEKKEGAAGGKSKHMRSARVSTSPIRGVKGGGLGLKSTKEFTRFRVLERPGACVGIADLQHLSVRYPFHVDCTSITNLFAITAGEIKAACASMSSDDRSRCHSTLQKEHKAHVDGLKYEPPAPKPAAPADAAPPSAADEPSPLFVEASGCVNSLLSGAADTLSSLRASRAHTRQLSDLLYKLGGEGGKAGGGPKRKVYRRASGVTTSQKGMSRDGGDDGRDEIEEKTGYATNLNNTDLANLGHAMGR